MNVNQLLVPPPEPPEIDSRDERRQAVWQATFERLEAFMPGFLAEVIPSTPAPPGEDISTEIVTESGNPS